MIINSEMHETAQEMTMASGLEALRKTMKHLSQAYISGMSLVQIHVNWETWVILKALLCMCLCR
jgi:hypothetical protein